MKKLAISTGPSTHLDHLAPLCGMWKIPLIITDPDHFELGKLFYPMIELQYLPLQDLSLQFLSKFDAIVTCGKFWAMELKPALKMMTDSEVRFIFSPHGNSDKESLLNDPVDQDIDLVYGPQMRALRPKGNVYEIGNVRHHFYHQHKKHFDRLAGPYFTSKKKTVLYAPTWKSKATSTSFFESVDQVIDQLGDEYHLLIKPHPLLEENNPALYYRAIGKYEGKALMIENFPAIYPLLEKTDVYLGDFSSIGYDFLIYDRPLFFLKDGGELQKCGKRFTGSIEDPQRELSAIRKKMYLNAFGNKKASQDFAKPKNLLTLRQQSL